MAARGPQHEHPPVPWRTIWATILSVGVVYAAYQLLQSLGRIVMWLVVALFFAIVLTPAVDFVHRRMKIRRGIATLIVFVVGVAAMGGTLYAFIQPVVDSATEFSKDLPQYVEDAREGKGWVGELVERYELEEKIDENQDRINEAISGFGEQGFTIIQRIFSTIVAGLTVMVLTFLIVLQGPSLSDAILKLIPGEENRERVRRVATDAARAVSGYIFGNLLISVIAGVAAWLVLFLLGVPYAEVLGLFVAFADLIPMIGATLGAVPTIAFAFLHSTPAGIITAIFFIVYQQFENHVLQVSIMSRTVNINPLTVLISVLIGVELFGFLGALLAIPAAGVIQVVVRDVYDEARGRLKPDVTVGAEERPAETEVDANAE